MPIMDGFGVSPEGVCGLTHTVHGGPFVVGPYMITEDFVGRSLTLSAATIRAYASALDLREGAEVDEELDRKDAVIYDQKAVINAQAEELKMLRPAAERFFILEGQKSGTDFEKQISDLTAENARLQKQLQQINRGGRPKKEEVAA